MNNLRDLRTGVIGVGSMGINHARIYKEISNLKGIFDLNSKLSSEVSEKFGVKNFATIDEMLLAVDAVTIAVPTILHEEVALKVIKSGTHLLIEKPLSNSVEAAEKILIEAEKESVVLAVGHIERYNPVVEYAKNELSQNKWGKVINLSSRRVSPYPVRISDVGVIFDIGIHDIDVISYLCEGKVESLYTSGGSSFSDNEDSANIIMNFSSGAVGICEVSWLTPMKIRKMAVTCTNNFAELDFISQSVTLFQANFDNVDKNNLFNPSINFNSNSVQITKSEPLKIEIIDFLSSILLNKIPLVTGLEAINNIRLAEASLESLKTNKVLNLV